MAAGKVDETGVFNDFASNATLLLKIINKLLEVIQKSFSNLGGSGGSSGRNTPAHEVARANVKVQSRDPLHRNQKRMVSGEAYEY